MTKNQMTKQKLSNFIKLTNLMIAERFVSEQLIFNFFRFVLPAFGILTAYFTYKYNSDLELYKSVFPNLII